MTTTSTRKPKEPVTRHFTGKHIARSASALEGIEAAWHRREGKRGFANIKTSIEQVTTRRAVLTVTWDYTAKGANKNDRDKQLAIANGHSTGTGLVTWEPVDEAA